MTLRRTGARKCCAQDLRADGGRQRAGPKPSLLLPLRGLRFLLQLFNIRRLDHFDLGSLLELLRARHLDDVTRDSPLRSLGDLGYRLGLDVEQLDVEDQGGVGTDIRTGTPFAVGEARKE